MPLPIPTAQAAINTLLQRGSAPLNSPDTFSTVANVSSINYFSLSAHVQETTSHSTGVPWRTKIPTLLEAGEVTGTINFVTDSVGHRLLLNDFANRVITDWRIAHPDTLASIFQCPGFFSKLHFKAPVDGITQADFTLTLTGDPVLPTSGGTYV